MNTSIFGVQSSMKVSTTVEEVVLLKVTQLECKISLNRKCLSINIYATKGARVTAEKISSLERHLN